MNELCHQFLRLLNGRYTYSPRGGGDRWNRLKICTIDEPMTTKQKNAISHLDAGRPSSSCSAAFPMGTLPRWRKEFIFASLPGKGKMKHNKGEEFQSRFFNSRQHLLPPKQNALVFRREDIPSEHINAIFSSTGGRARLDAWRGSFAPLAIVLLSQIHVPRRRDVFGPQTEN
jgi:hypothetical protein